MSETDLAWLSAGRGISPERRWSFTTDAPLVALELVRETGEILAADSAGGLYLLDPRGQVVALTSGFHSLSALAWSDAGNAGAACLDETKIVFLDRHLKVLWSRKLPDAILTIAVDPYGHHVAVSLANGGNYVFDSGKKKVSEFESIRPLSFLKFLASRPALVGAAEYGLLCSYELKGTPIWNEKLWSNTGDMSVTGDGTTIYLAGFSYGIQSFNGAGAARGSYVVEGMPSRVSTSFVPKRLLVTTLESHVYWLDSDGEMLWATTMPEEVCRICCDPLGKGIVLGFQSGRLMRLDWGAPD